MTLRNSIILLLWIHLQDKNHLAPSVSPLNLNLSHPLNSVLYFPDSSDGKESVCMQETWVQSLGWEDPLKEGMATHSSILAWRIPRTEEPGGLQSMGSQRVRHDLSD